MVEYQLFCPTCYFDHVYTDKPVIDSIIKCNDCTADLKVLEIISDLPRFDKLISELREDDYFSHKRAYLSNLRSDLEMAEPDTLNLIIAKPVIPKYEVVDY